MSDLVGIAKAMNNTFTYGLHVSAVLLTNIIILLLCIDGYQYCTKEYERKA